MFSDLECDYINPIDLCNKLNTARIYLYSVKQLGLLTWVLHSTVCPPRSTFPRISHSTLPLHWPMDCIPSKCSAGRIQPEKVRSVFTAYLPFRLSLFCTQSAIEFAHVWRNGNIPNVIATQERELYQARILSVIFLLLSLPVGLPLSQILNTPAASWSIIFFVTRMILALISGARLCWFLAIL